jgi:hypothetical protein
MGFARDMTLKEKKKLYWKKWYSKNKQWKKEYRLKYKERDQQTKKLWQLKNKKIIKEKMRLYRLKHKERNKKYSKEYRIKNSEKIKKRMKLYRIRSKEKIATYVRTKFQNDLKFRTLMNLRHRIYMALKGTVKSKRTIDLLGTSIDNLWNHLEKSFRPGMTKNNYGRVWHVDHKIPCAAFDLTKPKEQSKCFHFTNLQALFVKENLSKGAKLEWQN